jgi:membrane protein DedA with SNARE-associated domain
MFTLWQVVGGVAWAVGLTLAGHLLGASMSSSSEAAAACREGSFEIDV